MSECFLGCGRDRLPNSEIGACGVCSGGLNVVRKKLKAAGAKKRAQYFAKHDALHRRRQLLRDPGLVVLSSPAQRKEYANRDDVKVINRTLVLFLKQSTLVAAERTQQRQEAKARASAPRKQRRRSFASSYRGHSRPVYSEARA